jgi:hypothetical protein
MHRARAIRKLEVGFIDHLLADQDRFNVRPGESKALRTEDLRDGFSDDLMGRALERPFVRPVDVAVALLAVHVGEHGRYVVGQRAELALPALELPAQAPRLTE